MWYVPTKTSSMVVIEIMCVGLCETLNLDGNVHLIINCQNYGEPFFIIIEMHT